MKTAKSLLIKLFVAAALLLLVQPSHALHTSYMVGLSNQLTDYYGFLTNSPSLEAKKEARALLVALRDLKRPTTSVAQDYDRFFLAVLHLGNYAFTDPVLTGAGAAMSQQFLAHALTNILQLSDRTNRLNRFVVTRHAASRQIDQAYALLVLNIINSGDTSKTNQQAALLRGRRIFSKLVLAERLVVRGEARQGFAPEDNAATGAVFNYVGRNESGTITLTDPTNYTDANTNETVGGTYIYKRTGLNTATLELSETGSGVTTLRITFRLSSTGIYSYTYLDGTDRGRGAGRFSYTPPPPPPS